MNSYYTVAQAFEAMVIKGHEPSNTYVGRTQVLDPVLEAVTVPVGAEVHRLVGGTFLIMPDDSVYSLRLTKPPHVFVKCYGRPREEVAMDDLCNSSALSKIDKPDPTPDYNSAPGR